jgi:hypothetical protein
MPDIPVGSSISCYGLAHINTFVTTKIVFKVFIRQFDTDDDLSNNTQEVVFKIKPPLIPVLNWYSLIILT